MKYITNLIRKLIPKNTPPPLGRWGMESCNTKMNNKIDLSNEDHCGPCGQYSLTKRELNNNNKTNKNITNNDEK
jgi:hypothetical protein